MDGSNCNLRLICSCGTKKTDFRLAFHDLYCLFFVFSHGYYLFFGLHKEHWLALERALTEAKTAPKEQKDSSPSSESSHPSPRSSTSKEEERPGDEHEEYEETAEEEKDEYECVMS